MASKVEKFSVSLTPETLAQMDFIKTEYMHLVGNMPRSQLISACISIAYYEILKKLIESE